LNLLLGENFLDILKGKKWEVRSKVWLEINGKSFMGEGRAAVLKAIDRHGSMLRAAQETRISYRRIRGAIREMECALGRPLVCTRRGGENGGGAVLTDLAHELLNRFGMQQQGIKEHVDRRFIGIFK
jgi:molybdate transport system regulatory protein